MSTARKQVESILKQPPTPTPTKLQSRRELYDRQAEALCTLVELETQTVGPNVIDFTEVAYEHEVNALAHAIETHFQSLLLNVDFHNPRTIRKFYTAMRLHADELAAERRGPESDDMGDTEGVN